MKESNLISFRNSVLSLVFEICAFPEDTSMVLTDLDSINACVNELRARVEQRADERAERVEDEHDAGWVGTFNSKGA